MSQSQINTMTIFDQCECLQTKVLSSIHVILRTTKVGYQQIILKRVKYVFSNEHCKISYEQRPEVLMKAVGKIIESRQDEPKIVKTNMDHESQSKQNHNDAKD